MNCDEFNDVAADLGRVGGISGAPAEHARECPKCAERLEDERELSTWLREVALADSMEEAPLSVEARLLNEFRARGRRKRVPAWVAAAAACALVAVSVVGARLAIQRKRQAERPASLPVARPQPGPADPNAVCCPQRASAGAPALANARQSKRARTTAMERARFAERRRHAAPAVNSDQAGGDANGEVATDFIAVPYGNTLDPITGGQILRIRLPRSALTAVGLPVNQESTRGAVDADVLMDENMTVRAIRFVQ